MPTRHLAALCALLAAFGIARADDLPTYKILMKEGRIIPETLEVPAR